MTKQQFHLLKIALCAKKELGINDRARRKGQRQYDTTKQNHRLRFLFTKWFLKRRILQAEQLFNQARTTYDDACEAVDRHAASRYAASLWFRETHTPLSALQGVHSALKCATYSERGAHKVAANYGSENRGRYGEYVVFDALASALERGDFGHARLAADIFIPSHSTAGIDPSYTEIDMLLITERSIYVIEAKNLYSEVDCVFKKRDGCYKVYVRQGHNRKLVNAPRREDRGPSQNEKHCRALLRNRADLYANEIVNIVTYLARFGFQPPKQQGKNRVYLTTIDENSSADARLLVSAHERESPIRRTPEEVDALFDDIVRRYADQTGSKRAEHVQRAEVAKKLYRTLRNKKEIPFDILQQTVTTS